MGCGKSKESKEEVTIQDYSQANGENGATETNPTTEDDGNWACVQCTLHNPADSIICSACHSQRALDGFDDNHNDPDFQQQQEYLLQQQQQEQQQQQQENGFTFDGPAKGWFEEQGTRYTMTFELVRISLESAFGSGSDEVGPFTFQGSLKETKFDAKMKRSEEENHEVTWEGTLAADHSCIEGKWTVEGVGSGALGIVFTAPLEQNIIEEVPHVSERVSGRKPWACPSCTFENPDENSSCVVCETEKPVPDWACGVCTLHNLGNSPACEGCGTPKNQADPQPIEDNADNQETQSKAAPPKMFCFDFCFSDCAGKPKTSSPSADQFDAKISS